MTGSLKLYIFGDETGDFAESLQRLCERRKEVLSLHFLEELNKVLRDEVRRQLRDVCVQIPEQMCWILLDDTVTQDPAIRSSRPL